MPVHNCRYFPHRTITDGSPLRRWAGNLIAYGIILSASAGFVVFVVSVFNDTVEFVDASARVAQWRLGNEWPDAVSRHDVKSVSHKAVGSQDTYHAWYRIKMSEQAASEWIRAAHARNKQLALSDHRPHFVEGIQRSVDGAVALRCSQWHNCPEWWTPPNMPFESTEAMLWYATSPSSSGIGWQAFTAYDQSTGILWVFECHVQHHRLWEQGAPPDATEHFGHKANE